MDIEVGEVEGYRVFVAGTDTLSSYSAGYTWAPGANQAYCPKAGKRSSPTVWVNGPKGQLVRKDIGGIEGHGPIPSLGCQCGFWFYKSQRACRAQFADLGRKAATPFGDFGRDTLLLGMIKGWGRTIEGEDGWRSEYAKVTALITATPRPISRILERYGIVAVTPATKAEEGISDAYIVSFHPKPGGRPATVTMLGFTPEDPDGEFLAWPRSNVYVQLSLAGVGSKVSLEFESVNGARWITRVTSTTQV
jgi:hypothetical protein